MVLLNYLLFNFFYNFIINYFFIYQTNFDFLLLIGEIMQTEIKFTKDEILFLLGECGMVGIVKAGEDKMLFIGTPDSDEIVQYLEEDDLIAVSSFNLGEKYEKGIRSLAYLTRDIESPILVLPKDHPSSKRLKMVLSVQDILCSCDSLSGLNIVKSKDGVVIEGEVKNYKIEPF